jgi:hypothetical protein
MGLEIAFLHERLWPHAGKQLFFGDQNARALDQSNQDFSGTAAEANGCLTFQQKLLAGKKTKCPE